MDPLAIASAAMAAGGKVVDFFNSKNNADQNKKLQEQQMQLQKDFAQSGIQWKVADAKAAGIHPLFALGANTHSYSPISVGSTSTSSDFSGMGQDLGRAMMATSSKETRDDAFTMATKKFALENAGLDLEIKRAELASRIAKLKGGQIGPPIPTGPVEIPEAKKAEDRPIIMSGGNRIDTSPGASNAEEAEKRWGDIAQEIFGILNGWEDMRRTTGWFKESGDTIASRARDTYRLRWENARQQREKDYYLFR